MSSSSSTSLTTGSAPAMISPTMASISAGLLPTPSFGHVINVKLRRENFLLWKAQLLPFLRGQQLLGYVDGSLYTPAPMISKTVGDEVRVVPNPAYQVWVQQDQLVLSSLLSSLSPEVLEQVLFLSTSAEVWSALELMFSSQSRARIMQVRMQLSNMHKKDLSGAEYFAKMKTLSDTMASAGQPLRDEELISYILAGLDADYNPLVTSITTRADTILGALANIISCGGRSGRG